MSFCRPDHRIPRSPDGYPISFYLRRSVESVFISGERFAVPITRDHGDSGDCDRGDIPLVTANLKDLRIVTPGCSAYLAPLSADC